MEIQVKLYGMLRQYRPQTAGGAPHHPFSINLPEAATIGDLMTLLALPSELVAGVAVNQETAEFDTNLTFNDAVSFFPPTAGGTTIYEPG